MHIRHSKMLSSSETKRIMRVRSGRTRNKYSPCNSAKCSHVTLSWGSSLSWSFRVWCAAGAINQG